MPTEVVSRNCGYRARRAIAVNSRDAARRRSAPATSGRRAIRSAGTPAGARPPGLGEAGGERPPGPRDSVGVLGEQHLQGSDRGGRCLPARGGGRLRLGSARLGRVGGGQRRLPDARAITHPAGGLLPVRRRGLGQARLLPGFHGEEVEARRLPGERDPGAGHFGDRGLESGARRPRPRRGRPPQVRLPGQVEREPVGHIVGGEDFAFGEAGDRQADEVPPFREPGRAGLDLREERPPRQAGFGGGLGEPRRRPLQREVPGQRPLDHPVEFGNAERGPPVGFGGAAGLRRPGPGGCGRFGREFEFRRRSRRPESGAGEGGRRPPRRR